MRALLELYRAQCRVAFALELQYRVASLIYQIGAILSPLIYLVVWTTIARASDGRVGSFSSGDFAAYFIVLMLVMRATSSYVIWEYEYRVRDGTLSAQLLRPAHPFHKDLADNATHNALMLVALTPAAFVMAATFQPVFHSTPWAVATFVPALLLGFALRFTLEWTLALAAFWVTRISALSQMYFVALLFLSGQITPVSLLPVPLQYLANVSPFRWMIGFPVELLLGRLSPGATLAGLAAQCVWLAIGVVALLLTWRAGIRRYGAVGA
jgi:ABC-2 type transport system permease protein